MVDVYKRKRITKDFLKGKTCFQYDVFKSCTIELKNIFSMDKCTFDNCSFRHPFYGMSITNCKFKNCNFISLNAEVIQGNSFEGCNLDEVLPMCLELCKPYGKTKVVRHKSTKLEFSKVDGEFYMCRTIMSVADFYKIVPDTMRYLPPTLVALLKMEQPMRYLDLCFTTDVLKSLNVDYPSVVFRFPTVDEWRKAAYSDPTKKYPWGNRFDSKYCHSNRRRRPNIKEKLPNDYGLYDMFGLIYQECYDQRTNKYMALGSTFQDRASRINPHGSSFIIEEMDPKFIDVGFRPVLSIKD